GLPLHQVDLVDVHRFLVFEHRDHDAKADSGFSRRHRNHKNGEYLTDDLLQVIRKRNQINIHGIHHQFNRHQNDHDVPKGQNTYNPDREKRRSQYQIVMCWNHDCYSAGVRFFARTTAPTIATSRRMEAISNGNTYTVYNAVATCSELPFPPTATAPA